MGGAEGGVGSGVVEVSNSNFRGHAMVVYAFSHHVLMVFYSLSKHQTTYLSGMGQRY